MEARRSKRCASGSRSGSKHGEGPFAKRSPFTKHAPSPAQPKERPINATVVDWSDIPAASAGDTVRKRRIGGDAADLVLVEITAGTRAGRHSHPHEQFVQVISGNGVLETESGSTEFGRGSVSHFPPNAWHAAEFLTDTVLVETNLHEPRR